MTYRLVVCDLDGTLIGHDLMLSPHTKQAVRRLKDAGIEVTIATGRMFRASLIFAQELDIRLPFICYQGAMIKHPLTKETLYHRPLPSSLAQKVAEAVLHMGLHLNAYVNDELFVEELNEEAEAYSRLAQVPVQAVGNLLTFLDGKEPTKLVVVSDESTTKQLVGLFRQRFGPALYVTQSFPNFCEFANPECSKGKALARLCSTLDIAREETVAIGDNPNDLDMVEWAGLGIAMANAPSHVKAIADYITGSFEEEGAAQALERIAEGKL